MLPDPATTFLSTILPYLGISLAIVLTVIVLRRLGKGWGTGGRVLSDYRYRPKPRLMTPAEQTLYDQLRASLSDTYHIFPQIHLDAILDHTIKGQSWQGALSHIQRKSVDFVICDQKMKPLLAIELDDHSHDQIDRIARDRVVEAIFQKIAIPLLRIPAVTLANPETIRRQVEGALAAGR